MDRGPISSKTALDDSRRAGQAQKSEDEACFRLRERRVHERDSWKVVDLTCGRIGKAPHPGPLPVGEGGDGRSCGSGKIPHPGPLPVGEGKRWSRVGKTPHPGPLPVGEGGKPSARPSWWEGGKDPHPGPLPVGEGGRAAGLAGGESPSPRPSPGGRGGREALTPAFSRWERGKALGLRCLRIGRGQGRWSSALRKRSLFRRRLLRLKIR